MPDNEKKYISKVKVANEDYLIKDTEARDALALKANIDSPTFTGTPKAPTPSSEADTTQIATVGYVENAFRANDAMVFKGTIGTGGTVTALPTTYNAGWTYKVITAGTYAGKVCEIEDMIVCVNNNDTAANSSNNDWAVIQGNIDGAVTSSSTSSTDLRIAVFDGASGKVIKEGTKTIADVTNQNAFSNVKVGSTTVAADTTTDTVEFTNGVGIILTGDATNDKVNFKTKLKSETALTNDSIASGNTADRTYAVAVDKSGYLAVNVPWKNDNTDTKVTNTLNTTSKAYITGTTSESTNTGTQVFDTGVYIESTAGNFHADGTINGLIPYGTCDTAATTAAKTVTVNGTFTLGTGARVVVKFTETNTANSPTLNVNSTGAKNIYYRGSAINESYLAANRTYEFIYNGTQYDFVGDIDTDTHYSTHIYVGDGTNSTNTSTTNGNTKITIYDNATKRESITIKGSGQTQVTSDDNGTITVNSTTYTNEKLGQGYGTCSTAESTAAKTVSISNYELIKGGIVVVKFTYGVPANATLSINSKTAKSIYYNGSAITANKIKAGNTVELMYDGTNYNVIGFLEDDETVTYISSYTDGTLPSLTIGDTSNATTFNSVDIDNLGSQANLTTDTLTWSQGSQANLTTDTLTFSGGTVPSLTEKSLNWNQGVFPILSVDESTETLSLTAGTLPTIKDGSTNVSTFKAVNTFTAGSVATLKNGSTNVSTFKAVNTFTKNTLPNIKNGSTNVSTFKAVNTFTKNTLPTITSQTVTFNAGSMPVLTKSDKTVTKKVS